jgi:D-glutamate cyclase
VINSPSPFDELARIVLADPGRRGVAALARSGDLESACLALAKAKCVGILTGFYVPSSGACETDGPLGAAHLAAALRPFSKVIVCTDHWCLPIVRAIVPDAADDASGLVDCDVLVSIERLGRAADGRYYSMRGIDLTDVTSPLDEQFLQRNVETTTIGVGDGGNEIGMGVVQGVVRRSIPQGETISCVVPTDHLIVAGVSNWGAWALAAGVGLLRNSSPLPTPTQAASDLLALVAAGAVDGVTGRNEPTVDGLEWSVHADILEQLRSAIC